MFKGIFGFSFPGFETQEELQKLKEHEYYLQQKKIKEDLENENDSTGIQQTKTKDEQK